MKHFKIFVVVLTTVASLAIAGSTATAAVLTSPAGTEYTNELDASLVAGTTLALSAGISDTCTTSTVKGNVTTNDTIHAEGAITVLSFGTEATPCTKTTDVLSKGSLSIDKYGVVRASGSEVTILDLGVLCVYGGGPSPGTKLGTLKGGTPAVLEVNTTELPKISGGFLCASKGTLTGKYTVTTPSTLLVDALPPPPPAVLTSPAESEYTGELEATLTGSSQLEAGITDTCTQSTVKGNVEANSEARASGKISALSFGGCTKTTHVLAKGSLQVSKGGVVTAVGSEVTILDSGASCVYGGAAGTQLGTLKGGTPAVLEVKTTELPKVAGGFLCASKGTWTAKYTVTTPSTLLVD